MATIQNLVGANKIKDEWQKINNNFAALNSSKVEISDVRGFLGFAISLPAFDDYDELTTPGVYHSIYNDPKINEPYNAPGPRRVTVEVIQTPADATLQRVIYEDGVGAGRVYIRTLGSLLGWIEIFTTTNNQFELNLSGGYQKLASGLIYQWGAPILVDGGSAVFPIAFPQEVKIILPIAKTNAKVWTENETASGFTLRHDQGANPVPINYLAIGW